MELCQELRAPANECARDAARGEVWELLNSVISRYLRMHETRIGVVSQEDIEDIAAEKSLDLLRRAELGTWDTSGRSPSDITGFLSKVARNGLVDVLREAGRRVEPADERRPEWDVGTVDEDSAMQMTESPDILVERREFAFALRGCAEDLKPRSRLVWFLRVFLAMSSREIAAHPEVGLRVGHVDVLLQRTRDAIRDCMGRHGFESQDMPPGVFVEIWKAFRLETISI